MTSMMRDHRSSLLAKHAAIMSEGPILTAADLGLPASDERQSIPTLRQARAEAEIEVVDDGCDDRGPFRGIGDGGGRRIGQGKEVGHQAGQPLDLLRRDVALHEKAAGRVNREPAQAKTQSLSAEVNATDSIVVGDMIQLAEALVPVRRKMDALRAENEGLKRRLNEIYRKHTGQELSVIEQSLERDNFMTPDLAKEFGLIDQVIENRAALEA
mgnify:CR=1 FL=1